MPCHTLVSSDRIALQLLEQIIDVIVVDLDVRDEHAVVVVLVDVDTTQFAYPRTTVITKQHKEQQLNVN